MLDQFYNYLSKKIIDFFRDNPLTSGAKYNIQFETEEQVRNLNEALKDNTLKRDFKYKDKDGDVKYSSYLLDFEGIKLIVSATIDNVQPDFLTRLRNMVGVEAGYEDKAILFIHNTTLDSIMGGTESFAKEGMPFHVDSIEKDIQLKLVQSNFTQVDKEIINLDLSRKKDDLFGDNNSIFEYKDLLQIIDETCIEKNQYKNFGLFFDSKLKEYNGRELKKRLEKNATYYSRVDEIHNYGSPENQLERYFEEKGVEKLIKDNWREVDFKDVDKSIEAKKATKPLEYRNSSEEWDKEEGTSKAKARIRNIIVFNEDNVDKHEMEFNFDDTVYKEFLSFEGELEAVTAGKKIKATIYNKEDKSNFYKIAYKTDKGIKFEFKIVMLNCNQKAFDSIKTKFSIVMRKKNPYILLNTNDSVVTFNEYEESVVNYKILTNNEKIDLNSSERLNIKISEDFDYDGDSDLALFNLKISGRYTAFGIKGTNEKIVPIEGFKVWKLKREKNNDFKLFENNKLQFGTKDYFTRDEFRRNLEFEKQIIELEGLYFIDSNEGLKSIDLEINKEVKNAYLEIINYYNMSKKLPSLTYLNDEVKILYKEFIKKYIEALNNIVEGSYLSKEEKNLFKLGVIKREIDDREILFTPLHPLNIVYQLQVNEEINEEVLDEQVLKKYTSTYLLPYIIGFEDSLYVPMEQYHSPEWKYYVDEKLPRYKSSRDFVSKLVNEKIEEFIGHFKYMFDMGSNAPIRINLINTGDSKEILQGIFKYYIKQLKNNRTSNILPIELFIYSDKNITNAFEEVSFNEDVEVLKKQYSLDLHVENMSEEDVLDLYREKVHFYSKNIENGVEYAHITFIEMNNDVKTITSKMDDITSGVIFNGSISGLPSVFLGDSYRTGFGTRYANKSNDLMKVATMLNAIDSSAGGEPFNKEQCKAISIPSKSKLTLEKIYEASHWVTFIDPKVDLNFFKNDPEAKDLLIIHYSDQYTTAGGYDAITVTRKSGPYQKVIEEFLNKKEVENSRDYSPSIINMFNAINGDWLLRLLSSKSYFPKEKISILSAIKLALAKLNRENMMWVPISLEEVLRVSGGAGLKQTEGFFSAKNLGFEKNGATSDDILLVGIEEVNNEVLVHYYPVEVKIGENVKAYIEKGIEQAKSTKKIFNETLIEDEEGNLTVTQKIYRNFLMQLVITAAEKLNLYNVCSEINWRKITSSDLRRKLLNEEYKISNSLDNEIGEAAVISFKRGLTFRDEKIEDNVMVMEMSEYDGINYITKSITEISDIIGGLPFSDGDGNGGYGENNPVPIVIEEAPGNEDPNEEGPENSNGSNWEDKHNDIEPESPTVEEKEERNMEILFGTNQNNNKEIYWYPNDTDKVFHTNTGIIGTMGTGKTQFTKSLITQIYRESKYNVNGRDIGILIFDYKGDYNKSKTDFIEATNAKVFELFHLPFNPLSLVTEGNPKPMLPLHTANSLKETLAKAFGLGIKQETLLRDLIMEAYEARGIIKNKPDTWKNPAPTLKDVYEMYVNREDLKEDSLYAAFSNLIDFEIFEPNPYETKGLFDLIEGVTVIDLSGYDPGIQNLVVAITLDLFYAQMQAHGHSNIDGNKREISRMILVDEADNFLSKNFASLKKILKEGREFGVGTILSTQLLSHFSTGENDYANYILTWVIHNVAELNNKEIKYIFNTQSKQEDETIFNRIKSLNKHYSLVKMGDSDKAIYMKDKAFWELIK